MKRVLQLFLIFVLVSSAADCVENFGLLEKWGGSTYFHGVPYGDHTVERVFDGNETGNQMTIDIVRVTANKDGGAMIDRIWQSKVSISKIQLNTTGSGCVYEYKILYWDLVNQKWNEVLYTNENNKAKVIHELEAPIITNKMRFIPYKAGPDGEAIYVNIRQISYYGEFIPSLPPNEVEKVQVQLHEIGYIEIKWETPQPNKNGELPTSYNIYRSKENDFEATEKTLIADGVTGNNWVDITSKPSDGYYYSIKSVDIFGETSAISPIVIYK